MNHEALAKVIPRLVIQQVYASSISLKTNDDYVPAVGDMTTTQLSWGTKDLRIQGLADETGKVLNFAKIRFGTIAKILRNNSGAQLSENFVPEQNDILAEIEVSFVADYLILGEGELDKDGALEFAVHNTPYHVWPYWREYLQQLAGRANLPVPTLAFYQVPPSQKIETDAVNKDIGAAK